MNTIQFKTNINCQSCIRAVTPILNKLTTLDHWEVDTENPEKILTAKGPELTPDMVIQAIKRVGFEAELVA